MAILTTQSRFNVLADAAVIASGNLPIEFTEIWSISGHVKKHSVF